MIYFNNAATTYPKPATVVAAVERALWELPVEAGRGCGAYDPTSVCRVRLAQLCDVAEPRQVILTPSATYASNLVIQGLLGAESRRERAPAHVVTTA